MNNFILALSREETLRIEKLVTGMFRQVKETCCRKSRGERQRVQMLVPSTPTRRPA
jgi:hypothetical protein